MPPQVIPVQITAVPLNVATVPGERVTHTDGDRMIVYPPVRHAVDPGFGDRVAVDQIVTYIFAAFVGGGAIVHVPPGAAVDVHAGEDVPKARHIVEVDGIAG